MTVELELPGADATGNVFLTWTPVQARARLVNPSGTADVNVTLRNVGSGGRLRFANNAHASRRAHALGRAPGERSTGAILRRG